MNNKIIEYFRKNLRKKLCRPNCGRYLSIWDKKKWKKNITNIPQIDANDFLSFLFEAKYNLCCIQDVNGQMLCNALDKFFYVLFDLEAYLSIFIVNKIYKDRVEILNDIISFNQFNCLPHKLRNKYKYIELFHDLVKKTTEWNYWKRLIIISFAKITLSSFSYEYAMKNSPNFLQELINNIEKVFHKGLSNQINQINFL